MATPTKPGFMLSVIPFSGFYETLHDSALDRALELMFSDESGDPYPGLVQRAFDLVSWSDAQRDYAQAYADQFAKEFGIVGAEFESMTSPREYNFTTDRVFMWLPVSEVARMHAETPRAILDSVARDEFTSRSGFISFYSPDVDEWGELATWDHNQVFALVCAYVLHKRDGEEFDQWAEYALCEDFSGNGWLDSFISDAMGEGVQRLWKVCDYLRTRESREYRVGV